MVVLYDNSDDVEARKIAKKNYNILYLYEK